MKVLNPTTRGDGSRLLNPQENWNIYGINIVGDLVNYATLASQKDAKDKLREMKKRYLPDKQWKIVKGLIYDGQEFSPN